jgi:HK97 family phage major capsid protein
MSKVTIPSAPAELEEMLADRGKLDALMNAGQFPEFITAYARGVMDKDQDLKAQVKEQTQLVLAEFLKDNKQAGTSLDLDYDRTPSFDYRKLENKRAVGAPLNGVFNDLGEFMQTVWHQTRSPELAAKRETILNYQEKVPSEGGFLVPEEFRAELLRLSLESSVVRPRARIVPMASRTLTFPAIDETSRVSSVFGGIVVYRTEEGAELTESTAAFGSVKLEATKQTALAHVTNELVRDAAGGFAMYIQEMFPEAIAFYEDIDFISGNGAGAPLGALNTSNTAIVSVAKETGQAATTIVWENVVKMYARMLPSSLNRAVWLASPDTFAELATMALNVGTGGSAVWIIDGTGKPVLTLLGRPVIMSEKAPAALGTRGDLNFVDFGMYLVGDRQMMTVDSSEHVKFTSDKTTFRVIQRNDGRPWLNSPLTPHNNSATLSPFVQLDTRA